MPRYALDHTKPLRTARAEFGLSEPNIGLRRPCFVLFAGRGNPPYRFAVNISLCRPLTVVAILLTTPVQANETGFEVMARLYYDIEVMSFCGGATSEVMAAFRSEQTAVTRRHSITTAEDDRARFEAARRADREWKNRGLGGFRHWCRQEGLAAVRRFSPSRTYSRH